MKIQSTAKRSATTVLVVSPSGHQKSTGETETDAAKDSVTLSDGYPAAGSRAKDVYSDARPWDNQFSMAKLISRDGDKVRLSGIRWGYDENGAPANWTTRVKDTEIDTGKLTDVYVGMEPMLNVGHSTLIFEFSEPIKTLDGKDQDNRLVLSVEALRKEGQPYKPWYGFGKDFGLVYQMGSFSDRVQHTARKVGRSQELRRLNLTSEQKSDLLELALTESLKDRTGDYYHTTRDSCYSGTIKLLDQVVEGGMKEWAVPKLMLKPTMVAPSLTALAFNDRGLLADEPCQIIQPDAKMYPDAQRAENKWIDPVVNKLSKKSPTLWKRAFQAAGVAAGAAACQGLGAGLVTTLVGAAATGATAGVLADHLRLSAGHTYLSPEQFV